MLMAWLDVNRSWQASCSVHLKFHPDRFYDAIGLRIRTSVRAESPITALQWSFPRDISKDWTTALRSSGTRSAASFIPKTWHVYVHCIRSTELHHRAVIDR